MQYSYDAKQEEKHKKGKFMRLFWGLTRIDSSVVGA